MERSCWNFDNFCYNLRREHVVWQAGARDRGWWWWKWRYHSLGWQQEQWSQTSELKSQQWFHVIVHYRLFRFRYNHILSIWIMDGEQGWKKCPQEQTVQFSWASWISSSGQPTSGTCTRGQHNSRWSNTSEAGTGNKRSSSGKQFEYVLI